MRFKFDLINSSIKIIYEILIKAKIRINQTIAQLSQPVTNT
jgi:hypothetical protein